MVYGILVKGSHLNSGEDDIFTGANYSTREEADRVFEALERGDYEAAGYKGTYPGCRIYLLEDDVLIRASNIPGKRTETTDDSEWRREIAMEAGMLHGVDAYNEVMGWD